MELISVKYKIGVARGHEYVDQKEIVMEQSVWDFENEVQKREMLEPITTDNCGQKLKLVREISGMSRRDLAQVLGISESTISRLERGETKPTNDFINCLSALVVIGHSKYSNLSDSEKEKLSDYLGLGGGATAGVGGSIAAVSASGTVAGLSGAGITSGLAAIGGSMLGGLAVVASVPIIAGAAGYGLVKGIKAICKANKLSCKEIDGKYEIVPIAKQE